MESIYRYNHSCIPYVADIFVFGNIYEVLNDTSQICNIVQPYFFFHTSDNCLAHIFLFFSFMLIISETVYTYVPIVTYSLHAILRLLVNSNSYISVECYLMCQPPA